MKIIGLDIYGYGKFENLEIGHLSKGIQVVYGENEAGKSTIMSFILSILYGFPTKQQQEQRYEPKSGQKYGGKLIIQVDEYGVLMIERLPGKAVGDVVVYMPDGTTEGEAFLSKLLKRLDKHFFQNIYSFNVHGLQGIQRLGTQDLGRFLFSSGAVGTDALLTINQRLVKELEILFKPNGRKPILNAMLNDLKENHQKVVKLQEKNHSHHILSEKREIIVGELKQIDQTMNEYHVQLKKIETLLSLKTLILERNSLLYRLSELPSPMQFPEDGMKRMDSFLTQLQPYEAQLLALRNKKTELEKQVQDLSVDEDILLLEKELHSLHINKKFYEENNYQLRTIALRKTQIKDELQQLKDLISIQASEDEILLLDTSLAAKEQVKQTGVEYDLLQQQKHMLDVSFNEAKEALEDSEIKMGELNRELLKEEERKEIRELVDRFYDRHSIEQKQKDRTDEMNKIDRTLNAMVQNQKKTNKNIGLIIMIMGMILLLSSSYMVMNQQFILAIIPTLFLILLPFIYQSLTKNHFNHTIEELKEEKRILLEERERSTSEGNYSNMDNMSLQSYQNKLAHDQQIKQLLDIEIVKFKQMKRSYNKVVSQFEKWEEDMYLLNQTIDKLRDIYRVGNDKARLVDVFSVVESLKVKIREKHQLESQYDLVEKEIHRYEEKLHRSAKVCQGKTEQQDPMLILESIDKIYHEQVDNNHLIKNMERKLVDLNEQIEYLQEEVRYIQHQCQKLWAQAGVTTEDEFRKKAKVVAEKDEITERLLLVESQLSSYQLEKQDLEVDADLELKLEQYELKLGQLESLQKTRLQELSELNIRLEELEEGGTYAEVFHNYQLKKSTFQEQAKSWAILAVAEDILTKAIEQYREVRLPQLIDAAEKYVRILTNNRYLNIYPQEQGEGFIIERNDGIRFVPSELSQATAEQLYVAVRFALANTTERNQSSRFPFIIDDSFVNFDEQRLRNVIHLLREISVTNQILFFTCHDHVAKLFQEEEIIRL